MAKRGDRVEVYRDTAGGWRWRRRAGNHRTTADSGEAYLTRWGCRWAARRNNPGVPIVDRPTP